MANMPEIAPRDRNKLENTIPEKKIGHVRITATPTRPAQLEPRPAVRVNCQPTPTLISKSP